MGRLGRPGLLVPTTSPGGAGVGVMAGGGGGQGPPTRREPLNRGQIRVLLGLYLGYSSMIFSKAALDVAIPLMLEDEKMAMDSTDVGRLLTLCSAFYLVGKLSTGYSVDRLGAKFVFLWLASFTSAVLTGLVSMCSGSWRLTLIVCIMFVAQSSGWAALTSLVSSWLHASQYGMAFGFLSTSSRMGDVASKVVLGHAASWGYGWRSLFLMAGGLQMLTAVFNQAFIPRSPPSSSQQGNNNPRSPTAGGGEMMAFSGAGSGATGAGDDDLESSTHLKSRRMQLEKGSLSQALWNTIMTERFCYIAVGVACLHVVMEFDKYMPLYIHKSLDIGPGVAAQAAALYPLSQLVALTIAGVFYDRLSAIAKLVTLSGLSFLVFFFYVLQCLFKVYDVPVADWLYLLLIFMAGFSLAVPYYLPASIYIVELGGKKNCGTLSGILDACGGLAAMLFHSAVGALASEDRWIPLLAILCGAAFIGFLAITAFQRQQSSLLLSSNGKGAMEMAALLRVTSTAGAGGASATGAGDLRSRKARSSFEDEALLLLPSSSSSSALSSSSSSSSSAASSSCNTRGGQGSGASMMTKRGATPAQDFV